MYNDKDIVLLNNLIDYNHQRYLAYKEQLPFEENEEYEKLLNARYCKVSRIKKRLLYLFTRYKYIWFCTFTFDNYYIEKGTRTKRDLIKNVINSHDFKYILNIDYGKTTEREHYHCIIATNEDFDVNQFIQFQYPCFCLAINCKNGLNDFKKLSKYINKLTNHCIKATTKKQRLVYNFKGYDDIGKILGSSHFATLFYKLEYFKYFENDTLLDKGVVS